MNRLLLLANLIAVIFSVGLGIKFLAMPAVAQALFKTDYQTLMFQCDNVMRDHLIAKNRVLYEKSEASLKQLEAAEVGLLSCHDYDKLRKRMKIWGVTDDELSYIGLEAIEKNTTDIMEYVEIHEFKY